MEVKFVIAAFLVLGGVVLGHAYVRGYPPFTSQFVQTCEKAIQERLEGPSTYQRIDVDESRKTITFDEFFTDPFRAVSEATQKAMIRVARVPPVLYVALTTTRLRTLSAPLFEKQRHAHSTHSMGAMRLPIRIG